MKLLIALAIAALGLSAQTLPRLAKNGQATQLMVDGQPFLILGGELHNSSASSAAYMEPIWKKLVDLNVNTVFSTVSWELIEPVEGKFDFSSVDFQIVAARAHRLKLVLLWFGTWKNAGYSYTPMWVKRDPARFPLAVTKTGGPGTFMNLPMESLSPLGEATIVADAKAFRALMRHIREVDAAHTVIMMQVENETGIIGDSRDRSAVAEAAWAKAVPAELLKYLEAHRTSLLPEVEKVWGARGYRTSGTWAEVFGDGPAAGEIFMSWWIGRAVGRVAEAGKAELALPMYANAWLGPQPKMDLPGDYPSGGPVTGMLDVWRAAAPKLDLFAPDIYVADFEGVCASQVRSGNPLFIPEARPNLPNLFWAVGHHAAIAFSPFGIEDFAGDKVWTSAYGTLAGLAPLILKHQTRGEVSAIVEGNSASVEAFQQATGLKVKFGGTRALFAPQDLPPAGPVDAAKPEKDTRGYALVIRTGQEEFVIAGANIVVTNELRHLGIVEEGRYEKGRWVPMRRLNGDETFSGIFFSMEAGSPTVLKVTTYPIVLNVPAIDRWNGGRAGTRTQDLFRVKDSAPRVREY